MKKNKIMRMAAMFCAACVLLPVAGYAAKVGGTETAEEIVQEEVVPEEPVPEEPQTEPPTEPQTELITTTTEVTETITEVSTTMTTETAPTTVTETETTTTTKAVKTNEQLIAEQHIVIPSVTSISYEFRFQQDSSAQAAIIRRNTKIYESGSADAAVIGFSENGSIVYILADADQEWVYVESGSARGFVKNTELVTGEAYTQMLTASQSITGGGLEDAVCTVSPLDNAAMTYTKTTAYNPVVGKVYAAAASDGVNIYDASDWVTGSVSSSASVVGIMSKDAICYILADADKEAVYIESGEVRGFVRASDLITGSQAQAIVSANGEGNTAQAAVSPENNRALYYTVKSVETADTSVYLRQELIDYALQFVGNPYVYGGNSLTDGIDCSGFTQQIYGHFGYTLGRTAEEQSVTAGMQIPVEYALPGDLIFYATDGEVGHVAIYMGDNRTVQAANSSEGIIVREGIGGNAVWAVRVIQ